jgi:hypothetical protein
MCFAALSNGIPEANEFKKHGAPLGRLARYWPLQFID